MASELANLDPAWAWRPYVATHEQPLGRALAAHLYRRAGFAADEALLAEAAKCDAATAVRQLLQPGEVAASFRSQMDALTRTIIAAGNPQKLAAVWLYRMLHSPRQLEEKATLFWHGHFATGADKVDEAALMHDQIETLRKHALGDFAAMTHEVSRDPAMLIYLDSATNRKAHPNENFAREVMELFCLGEGHYSEKDIQELSRCFTGWEVKQKKFRFNRYQHDPGDKTILGQTGPFGGEEGVKIVLERPDAPRFIVRKLVRFFVRDEPELSDEAIEPLAVEFREHNLDIAFLVERILTSELFYSEHAVGRKVRSPIELAVGLLRSLEGSTDTNFLGEELRELGQGLYFPPNVKGWDGGRAWINSATLLGRTNLVQRIVDNDKTRFAGGALPLLFEKHGVSGPEATVDWLAGLLLATPLAANTRARLVVLASEGDPAGGARRVICALGATPEFQLG
jgi:uncharacterized protein (DUF1800 family)